MYICIYIARLADLSRFPEITKLFTIFRKAPRISAELRHRFQIEAQIPANLGNAKQKTNPGLFHDQRIAFLTLRCVMFLGIAELLKTNSKQGLPTTRPRVHTQRVLPQSAAQGWGDSTGRCPMLDDATPPHLMLQPAPAVRRCRLETPNYRAA